MRYAKPLLISQFFSQLHSFVGNSSLYAINKDRLLEWSSVKQLRFTAPALSVMLALLLRKVSHSLHLERHAVERPEIIEMDDEESALTRPPTSAEVGLSLEKHRPLVYTSEAALFDSVHSSLVQKRKPSSSKTTSQHSSKKMRKSSPDEKHVKDAVRSLALVEDVIDATAATSSALRLKAEITLEVLQVSMRKYCLAKNTCFSLLQNAFELEKSFSMHQNVTVALTS